MYGFSTTAQLLVLELNDVTPQERVTGGRGVNFQQPKHTA